MTNNKSTQKEKPKPKTKPKPKSKPKSKAKSKAKSKSKAKVSNKQKGGSNNKFIKIIPDGYTSESVFRESGVGQPPKVDCVIL